MKEKELEIVCKEQAARIEQLNQLVLIFFPFSIMSCGFDFTFNGYVSYHQVEKLKGEREPNSITVKDEEKVS